MKKFVIFFFMHMIICGICLPSFAQDRGVQLVQIVIDGKPVTLYNQSHALVIGVSNYRNFEKLPGVSEDVNAVKTALETQGFHVVVVMDPDHDSLKRAFSDFIGEYGQDPENRLLFYYAGHGYSYTNYYHEQLGYLVPTDAPLPLKDHMGIFQAKCIEMAQIEIYARTIQSKHALFLFDACFSGSLFQSTRAIPEYIDHNSMLPVRQFITSGSADETVPDKSLFRKEFIAALSGAADNDKDGYITGTELGTFIQKTVINYSHDAQHPQYGKIRNPNLDKGDFIFVLNPAGLKPPGIVRFGNLNLTSQFPGTLYLDEALFKQIGSNTLVPLTNLSEGNHTLKITGEETQEQVLYILPDQTVTYTFERKKQQRKTFDGFEMVFVEGGTFFMGGNDGAYDEAPAHRVTTNNFYMGRYEVMQRQWQDVMGMNPSKNNSCNTCPVENVSWNDVQEFLTKLNQRTGKKYRLPTEAEWEYAAGGGKAGKGNEYSGGSKPEDVAWFKATSDDKTHPVGKKKPNELGIYDMSGNVWEWCSDFYDKNYYVSSQQNDPRGPQNTNTHVIRGGSWEGSATNVRVKKRGRSLPEEKSSYYGFRICLSE